MENFRREHVDRNFFHDGRMYIALARSLAEKLEIADHRHVCSTDRGFVSTIFLARIRPVACFTGEN